MFRVNINHETMIYAYHLDFYPEVQADNRDLKREILTAAGDLLKQRIGNFANSGQNLYGTVNPSFEGGVEQPEGFKPGKGRLGAHTWIKLKLGS